MLNGYPIFQFDVTVGNFHFSTLGKLGFEMKEVCASRQFQHRPLPRQLQERPQRSFKALRLCGLGTGILGHHSILHSCFDTSTARNIGFVAGGIFSMIASRKLGGSQIYIGPAGWSYPDWKRILYPDPRPKGFHEATFLAEFFNTIEINTSFYHPMQPAHAEQWIERVAANPKFLFTAKLWRNFTHDASTTAADVALVRAGFDILQNARRLGAMLLQFPFSFHHTPETIKRLTVLLDQFHDYPLVVEVRHASWAKKEFYDFLHQRRVGFCNIDH